MGFDEDATEVRLRLDSMVLTHKNLRLSSAELQRANEELAAQVLELKKQLAAGGSGGSASKPPAILVHDFSKPVPSSLFYLDKTRPADVIVANGYTTLRWNPAEDLDSRSELVMRQFPGTSDGTPRRDPVSSLRWYGWGLWLPEEDYKLDEFQDSKTLTGQWHQGNEGGIDNPPLSVEQRNGRMQLVLSLLGRERKYWPLGPIPRSSAGLLFRIRWDDDDGAIDVWKDGAQLPIGYRGPTCNPLSIAKMGLNHKIGNYNPGDGSGLFARAPAGWERRVRYTGKWVIGDESNALADFLP